MSRKYQTLSTAAADFLLVNHGSILVLTPMSSDAQEWVHEHLLFDLVTWGRGVVIEPRYWPPIHAGIDEIGLAITVIDRNT